MATTGIDKLLRGVDDLQRTDTTAEIDEKIAALEDDLANIRVKLAVLKELRKQPRRQPADSERPNRAPTVIAKAGGGSLTPHGGGMVEVARERPHGWKRDAIAHLVTSEPGRVWTASDVRAELNRLNIMDGDEGTPTRLVLRRLHEAGLVQKVGTAAYVYAGERLSLR